MKTLLNLTSKKEAYPYFGTILQAQLTLDKLRTPGLTKQKSIPIILECFVTFLSKDEG
jgi:hypothetical protein